MAAPEGWKPLLEWIAFPERFAPPLPFSPGLKSAYRGCLLGLACGNVLGVEVEGWSRAAILARYPEGVQEPDPQERFREWDDDVAQALILGEALLSPEGVQADRLGQALVDWMRRSGRGIGTLTAQVLGRIAGGEPAEEAAQRVWEISGRQSAGNGAVMRCAPVALRWWREPERLIRESLASARVTHADPRCQWSTVVVTSTLAVLLRGTQVDLPSLAGALQQTGAPESVCQAVRETQSATLADLNLDGPSMGFTLKAMQVALWASQVDGEWGDRVRQVVNQGGDTDTNGAVAGAVLGVRLGEEAIPGPWIGCLPHPEQLTELADRLLAAAETG
ncbi:MAG: hypothetical protein D6715_06510 [Calditrichaeota bacterium]|nr:MAG: hypothetical protein D6715_06510 [Calditrichota bacterium]